MNNSVSTPIFTRKPWGFDDGSPILVDGTLLKDRGCEFAIDAAPKPEPSMMPVIEMGTFITLQPSAKAMREAALIASFYEGVPHAIGKTKHDAYLLRKAERSLAHD
ncbi:MAG: hypothetical protein ABSC76_10395 [Terracidiphilus sp.]